MSKINIEITANSRKAVQSFSQLQTQIGRTATTIGQSGKSIGGFFEQAGRQFDNMKDNLVSGLKSITMGVVGFQAAMDAGAFVKSMYDNIGQFNKAMKEVSTISDEVTNDMQGYKDQLLDLTAKIPIGATDAAKALYQIVSAGQQGADAMKVLEVAAKGAIAGVTDTATTADAITTILNAYHMGASEAEHISDLLFTTVKRGKTTMAELGASIAQVAPTAGAYGIKIEELMAAVATITKQGVPTAQAMTQLNAVITQGVEVLGDGAFRGRSFAEALGEIEKRAGGSLQDLKGDVSNIRAMKAVLEMTGKAAGDAAADLEAMGNASGAAEEAFGKMFDTQAAQRLENNIQKMLQPIGDQAKAFHKDIINSVSESIESGAIKDYLAAIEGIVAAYGIYRGAIITTMALESLHKSSLYGHSAAMTLARIQILLTQKAQALLNATMLTNPYVAAAAAIGLLVGALVYYAQRASAAEDATEKLNEKLKEQNENLQQAKQEIDTLIQQADDDADATGKREEALQKLIDKYPDIITKYIDEEGHLRDIISLKRELYEVETQKKYEAQKAEADKYKKYGEIMRKAVEIERSRDKKKGMTAEETALFNEAVQAYRGETGNYMDTNTRIAEYYSNMQRGTQRAAARTRIDNTVNKFTENIGKMADNQLNDFVKMLDKGLTLTEGGKKGVQFNYGGLNEYLEKNDFDKLLSLAKGVQNARQDSSAAAKSRKQQAKDEKKRKAAEAAAKKNAATAKQIAQDADNLAALQERQDRERQRAIVDQQFELAQARIDADKVGMDKVIAQIELDYNRELETIKREGEDLILEREEQAKAMWEAENAVAMRNGKTWRNSGAQAEYRKNNSQQTKEDEALLQAKRDQADKNYKREILQQTAADFQYKADYLKAYGSFQEQKAAIAEEYDRKIALSENEYERMSLEEQKKEALAALDFTKFQKQIDWELIFNDLDKVSKKHLQQLKEQLEEYMAKGIKDGTLNPENAKALAEAMGNITREQNSRKGMLDYKGDTATMYANKRAKAEAELLEIEERRSKEDDPGKLADLNAEYETATKRLQDINDEEKQLKIQLSELSESFAKVAGQLNSAFEILDRLGLGDTALGQAVGLAGSGTEKASAAMASWASGDYLGAASSGIGALKDYGKAVGSLLGIGGGNADEVNKITAENTEAIQRLSERIERLKDAIDDADVMAATEAYQAAVDAQTETNSRAMQTLQAQMGYSSAHHSNAYYADDSEIARLYSQEVNNATRAGEKMAASVRGLNDLYTMTPEQIAAVKTYMPALWEYLTTIGKYDKSEYWEGVVDQAGKLDDLTKQLNERLTTMSFDSLKDSFSNLLKSMSTTSQDWADNFEDMLRNAVINALSDTYSSELEKWYKNFAAAIGDNGQIDAGEKAKLLEQYNGIVAKAEASRDALYDILDIKDSSGSAQSTINAVQSVSEDTASDIVGRMTAMQISVEANRATLTALGAQLNNAVLNLTSMLNVSTSANATLEEIRNMIITNSAYLEDIAKYSKSSYTLMADKLARIASNTDKL